MSTCRKKSQSAIEATRDQLGLDTAEGKFLTTVTSNVGLYRPAFGFSDDTWRALGRTLALNYRQIRQKFIDVFSILFGPKVTEVGTLSSAVPSGETFVSLNDTGRLPQVGTMVLDEGLLTEEALDYCFIDRATHTVYFTSPTTHAHGAALKDAEQPLLLSVSTGDTSLILASTHNFPTSGFPYTLVVGRGTPQEEVVQLLGNDLNSRTLTVSALANDHSGVSPSTIFTNVNFTYTFASEYLSVDSVDKFPDEGTLLLLEDNIKFEDQGGSTTTVVQMLAGSLTADRHVGNRVVFRGDTTAALTGVERVIVSNTASTVTLDSPLPVAPSASDTFFIRPVVSYYRLNIADSAFQLVRDITDVPINFGVQVELLSPNTPTASLAPVQVKGAGWDVIQSDPRNIEVLLPSNIQDPRDLRSSSYLHDEVINETNTITAATAGDTQLTLDTTHKLPPVGYITVDPGGAGEETVGYAVHYNESLLNLAGSTPGTIASDTAMFGDVVDKELLRVRTRTGENWAFQISNIVSPTEVDLTRPVFSDDFTRLTEDTRLSVQSSVVLDLTSPLANTHGAVNVEYTTPTLPGTTTVQSGDVWNTTNTFPGPYLYSITDRRPDATAVTSLSTPLAGETFVALSQAATATALEVDNATSFPSVFPYTLQVGEGTGNIETVRVTSAALKDRTGTTIAAPATAGDTSFTVTSAVGTGALDDLPVARGYRLLLNSGAVNEEVVYVQSVSGTTVTLLEPLVNNLNIADTVELMADVLTVDPLDDEHDGAIVYAQRREPYAPVGILMPLTVAAELEDTTIQVAVPSNLPTTGSVYLEGQVYRYSIAGATALNILDTSGIREAQPVASRVYFLGERPVAEKVNVLYDEISVASSAGFSSSGGTIILNFGNGVTSAEVTGVSITAGDTTITATSASTIFPTSFPFELVIAPGTPAEERHMATNIIGNTITLNNGTNGARNSHTDCIVRMEGSLEETLSFTGTGVGTLTFDPPVVLHSTHTPTESVVRSTGSSSPRPDGYDFPLRMPSEILTRISFLFDLIRAAGVQVTVISER